METSNEAKNEKLKPINTNEIEGLKQDLERLVYKEYFNEEQLAFINSMLNNHLHNDYNY